MSRVTDIQDLTLEVGTKITLAYDIPSSVWYFSESAYPTMPFVSCWKLLSSPADGWLRLWGQL